MKAPHLFGIGAALLACALVGVGLWLQKSPENKLPQEVTGPRSSLPQDVGAMLAFTTTRGEVVSVPDFTYGHPSLDIEDTGQTFVYVTQNDAAVEESAEFGIIYANDGSLIVGLFTKPLGQARLSAEQKLRTLMKGIPDDILCRLPISVNVLDTIEPMYAGKELGLSFCPGAVPLP